MGSSRRSRWTFAGLCVAVALTQAGCCTTSTAKAGTGPLCVDSDGAVLRDGRPYRAIGINYFSAFSRTLENPADASYRDGFDVLLAHDIPFVRFMACGFYPNDWKLYLENRNEYFRRMDAFVKSAEEKGMGLVPSLFWWLACVPDVVGEPCSQWGNPSSKTVALMRQYVTDVVGRYAKSPAIWAWELGNEYSLSADLPREPQCRPQAVPDRGTPAVRTEADDLSHDMLVSAYRDFAKIVRANDPWRPITTGNSLPRPAAQHLRFDHSWEIDSQEELVRNLLDVTPDPVNMISVHVYPMDQADRFPEKSTTYAQIFKLCMEASAKSKKALFVGEFGAPDTDKDGGPEAARQHLREQLAAIDASGVPLAALWVYDLPQQDSFINISTKNHRSHMLDELQQANARLREKGFQR